MVRDASLRDAPHHEVFETRAPHHEVAMQIENAAKLCL
jgi:hypothetical protein